MDSFYGIFVSFLELESLLSLFGGKKLVCFATQKMKKSFWKMRVSSWWHKVNLHSIKNKNLRLALHPSKIVYFLAELDNLFLNPWWSVFFRFEVVWTFLIMGWHSVLFSESQWMLRVIWDYLIVASWILHIHFLDTNMVVCIFLHRIRLFGLNDMQLLWNVYGAVCVKQQWVHRSSKLYINCELPKTSYLWLIETFWN